jgi:hypothetical protein
MKSRFPRLFSFALDENISVQEVMTHVDLSTLFELPLSKQAFDEFQSLRQMVSQWDYLPQLNDKWCTIWKDGVFTSSLYYQHYFKDIKASSVLKWIWKSRVLLRIKVFGWLLVNDRLNTKDMLRRRHWTVTNNLSCVLCPTHIDEDWLHLFFHCNFSQRVWNYLQIEWEPGDTMEEIFCLSRRNFTKPFFTEVVLLATWHIWKQRNEAIFQGVLPSFRGWRRRFVQDALLHVHRIKDKHVDSFKLWVNSLV